MLYGAADDFIPVLRGKQMLRERGGGETGEKWNLKFNTSIHNNIYTHTHKLHAYQSAEAPIKDAESPLVIRDLDEALYIAIVVGTHHPVGVRVDLVDAAWRHL